MNRRNTHNHEAYKTQKTYSDYLPVDKPGGKVERELRYF